MHDRIRFRRVDRERNGLRIVEIALNERCAWIDGQSVTFRQIVEHNDLIPSLKKLFNADAPDIAGAACNQNLHKSQPVIYLLFDGFYHSSEASNPLPRFQNLQADNI